MHFDASGHNTAINNQLSDQVISVSWSADDAYGIQIMNNCISVK